MSDLDAKRLDRMNRRGGLPSVDELVAMWRVMGSMSFSVANERTVVTEARRRIREAGRRLGKTHVRTLHHKHSGMIFGLMEYTAEEEAVQSERLRKAMADMYPKD